MEATTFKLVLRERNPSHDHLAVFVGPEGGTLALAGTLCFGAGDFQLFASMLGVGYATLSAAAVGRGLPDWPARVEVEDRTGPAA